MGVRGSCRVCESGKSGITSKRRELLCPNFILLPNFRASATNQHVPA
jgi:hypothetical protein